MKALLGWKIGMSQMFSEDGDAVPVTLISAEPNEVVLRRLEDRDGYTAVQLALPVKGARAQKAVAKAATSVAGAGQQSREKVPAAKPVKARITPGAAGKRYAARREFNLDLKEDVAVLTVEQFTVGDTVDVAGISKGKGYQGVVKRHGFRGGPASHGHRHVLRRPGSIGSGFPQHVFKGKRMAGRMGTDRVTTKNLRVVWVDPERNILAIKGAVPGTRGSLIALISNS